MSTKSQQVRTLNDQFRMTFHGGKVMMTHGIQDLGDEEVALILLAIQRFDQFTDDNDPHGEHDFGSFKHDGRKVFFKIDYYDRSLTVHSPDKADHAATTRVLTIMRADEY